MLILQKLFEFNLPVAEMINIYILYIRSILETSAVVWHSSIGQAEEMELERVQKVALRIILDDQYDNYLQALLATGLPSLKERRKVLCKKFAINCRKSKKTCHWFPLKKPRTVLCPTSNYWKTDGFCYSIYAEIIEWNMNVLQFVPTNLKNCKQWIIINCITVL